MSPLPEPYNNELNFAIQVIFSILLKGVVAVTVILLTYVLDLTAHLLHVNDSLYIVFLISSAESLTIILFLFFMVTQITDIVRHYFNKIRYEKKQMEDCK